MDFADRSTALTLIITVYLAAVKWNEGERRKQRKDNKRQLTVNNKQAFLCKLYSEIGVLNKKKILQQWKLQGTDRIPINHRNLRKTFSVSLSTGEISLVQNHAQLLTALWICVYNIHLRRNHMLQTTYKRISSKDSLKYRFSFQLWHYFRFHPEQVTVWRWNKKKGCIISQSYLHSCIFLYCTVSTIKRKKKIPHCGWAVWLCFDWLTCY